jgi:hypothetical protein
MIKSAVDLVSGMEAPEQSLNIHSFAGGTLKI